MLLDEFAKFKPNFILISIVAVMYMLIVYKFGIAKDFMQNITLIKYLILVPMLVSIFVIDYKHLIIPNRMNLTMFEIGLVFTFIYGISNVATAQNKLCGMLAGGGLFLGITLLLSKAFKLIFKSLINDSAEHPYPKAFSTSKRDTLK